MMSLIFVLLTSLCWSKAPARWSSTIKVVEKHEFYQNNEVLLKPKNSWETLFALIYADKNLNLHKDCVFYKVPGDAPGILKVKTTTPEVTCDQFRYQVGDIEVNDLKSLQFALTKSSLYLQLTSANFKADRWDTTFLNDYVVPEVRAHLSSADYQGPKLLMVSSEASENKFKYMDKGACHEILDDCSEKSPNICDRCSKGWFEIPNGCAMGPKFCGVQECGEKNQPACRRGMKYQRLQKKYDCRIDNSFAYCSRGLRVECEGSSAFCR